MTGIEKIVAKIHEDAVEDSRRIVEEAEKQADRLLSEAAAAARASAAEVIRAAEEEREEIERRAVSMAGLEVRKMRLELKQKLLQQAFDQAFSQLISLPETDYETFLTALVSSAAENGAELVFSAKDREKYGAAVVSGVNALTKKRGITVSLSEETRDIPGGVIICNGRVEINCAFDTLIRDQREALAAETAKILF